jgi:hypothetical protein
MERQLKHLSEQKQQLGEQLASINNLFDFSQLGAELPPLQTPISKETDCTLELKRIKRMQQELLTVDCRTQLTETEQEAAAAIARVTKKQWEVAAATPRMLRIDVSHLKKVAIEQENTIRKLDADVTGRRRSLFRATSQDSEADLSGKVRSEVSAERLEMDVQRLDDEIQRLHERIDRAATHFTEVVHEIDDLRSRELIVTVPDTEEEEEEEEQQDEKSETESVDSVPVPAVDYPERALLLSRNELQFEIADLRRQIKRQRKVYKARELKLKKEIQGMYKLLATRTEGIRIEQQISEDSASSQIQEQMASLMLHIGSSITDLRRELESA